MSLPVLNFPIQVLAGGKAVYTPVISAAGGATAIANQEVLFFDDGVLDSVAGNAIAAGTTNASGQVIPGVALIPGCIYRVTAPNDTGSFAGARFCASGIVGPLIVPGDNVSGS